MMKLSMIGVLAAIGLVAAFGLYLVGIGLRNVSRAVASARWPTTAGKVVRSETSEQHDVDRKTRDVSVTYSADTVIQYAAGGKAYTTNLIHIGQTLGSGDESDAELQRLRYPVDGAVSVRYDPAHPWIAVARPGLHAEAFWLPGAGLAFLLPALLALFVFVNVFKAMPQQAQADDAFAKSVQTAIDNARRGIPPPDIPPPKSQPDAVMPVAAGVFGAIFLTLGILGLSSGAQRLWRASASENWPTVEGKVLFSKVNTEEIRDANRQRAETFSPEFVYTYQIAGVKHFNNLRRFGQIAGGGEDWAADVAAHYPVGKAVRVHYYPADPDVAVLEPGRNSEGLWLPGAGLVALLFGLATLIWLVPALAK